MKSALPLALAVTAVRAAHEPVYVTEYYDECSTLPTTTIIDTVIHDYTPHAGVLTTYTTVYSQICSTGWEPKTFTVTEPCTETGQARAPTYIPQGFVQTTVTCHVCAETPVVAVITSPVPVPPAPGSGKTPAPVPAAPTPAGANPGGNPPASGGSAPPAGVPPPAGSTPVPGGGLPAGAPPGSGGAPPAAGGSAPASPPGGSVPPAGGNPAPAGPPAGDGSVPGGSVSPAGGNPAPAGPPVSGGNPAPAGPPASGGSVPGGSVPPAGVNPPAVGGSGAPIPKTAPGTDLPADSGIVPFTGTGSHRSIGMSFSLAFFGVIGAVVWIL